MKKRKFNKVLTALIIGNSFLNPMLSFAEENNQKVEKEQEEKTEEVEQPVEEYKNVLADDPIKDILKDVDVTFPSQNYGGFTSEGDVISFSNTLDNSLVRMLRDTGNSTGKLTKYYSDTMYISTPYITINDLAAWCVAPDKGFPVNQEYGKQVYKDPGVYNILYWALQRGWDANNENYVDVFVALNAYLGHTYQGVDLNSPVLVNSPNVAFLLQKAKDQDAPTGEFDFLVKQQTADFNQETKKQFTDWYTPKTDGTNVKYTIDATTFPSDIEVELSNGQKFSNTKVEVSQDIKFRLTAPANYTGTVKFDVPTNYLQKAALLFKPQGADLQDLVTGGGYGDPVNSTGLSGTFFAREGQLQVGKQDKVTGQMVANTGYTGTIGDDQVAFTTDATGWAPISEKYIDGTPYNLVETNVPAGYTLDQTPITGTIKAGETLKLIQQNDHQNAVVTFEKEKEVFDAEETTLKGEPVYKNIPLEGAEFTNKNNNDTTAPDQETVLTPAGEYLDTMVTDSEGKGKSTIPFVNGEQNEYIFDETNEPENYRQFEPVTFNVPYEVSTVDVATFDLGIFKNELKKGQLDFNKKNDVDFGALLNVPGARMHLEGITENTKDVNFEYTSTTETNKMTLKAGKYKLSEVKYPDGGWTLSPNQPHSMIIEIMDNTTTTVNWENTRIPMKITTLFATVDGKKVIDPTVDNKLEDTVQATDAWINTPMVFYTEFVAIRKSNGVIISQRVVGTDETEKTFKEKSEKFKVPLDLKKNTLKEGESLVATHVAKTVKDQTEAGREDNLYNLDQTIVTETAKTPTTPAAPNTPTKTGTFPSTGETVQSTLLMLGLTLMTLVSGLFFFKKVETDELA